jgi:hypothetical protein
MEINIQLGKILYQQSLNGNGTLKLAALLFVDTEPKQDEQSLMVT